MSSNSASLAAFIEATPPGELANVTSAIKTITGESSLQSLGPALKKYHEEQYSSVKLPASSATAIVSSHNFLGNSTYYDVDTSTSFVFDHATGKASDAKTYALESTNIEIIKSILKSLKAHTAEHYDTAGSGVFPTENDAKIAIITVATKFSPNNYINGKWRSSYIYDPASSSVSGEILVDVHYYEDGNVRLITSKDVTTSGSSAAEVVKAIAIAERKYQEELNRGFSGLSEGAFKSLRRNLPVSRSKMAWERWEGMRIGQDIGGGRQAQK